jgi:hypothetical protein
MKHYVRLSNGVNVWCTKTDIVLKVLLSYFNKIHKSVYGWKTNKAYINEICDNVNKIFGIYTYTVNNKVNKIPYLM